MKQQAGRACIVADYKESYDKIKPDPDYYLVEETRTRAGTNPYYLEDLLRRAEQMGIDTSVVPDDWDREWKRLEQRDLHGRRALMIPWDASPGNAIE
jgi:hypothetical protein